MHLPILSFKHVRKLKSHVRDTLFIDSESEIQLMKSTTWADGLRGLATIGVVASHLSLCFARSLLRPCCSSDDTTPKLFQLPIFRLVASGHSWVAVFFLLMGFVNALKPLKLAQANQHDEALANLANSSLRRVLRLVLPATLTTVIAWFLCQLHLMEKARQSDAWWLYTSTAYPSSSFPWAVSDLLTAIGHTWLYHSGDNIYNQPQWTIFPLLQGSLMLLLALLFTINLTPTYRNIFLTIGAIWSVNLSGELRDPLVGLTTLTGIIFSGISIDPTLLPSLIQKNFTPYLSTFLTLNGLILMSVPSATPEKASWSQTLNTFGQTHLPYSDTMETFRFIGSIGAIIFVSGIIISPVARSILSIEPLTYLGKISFPVFLLHPIFMQIVLPVFAFRKGVAEYPSDPPVKDKNGMTQMVLRHPQRGGVMIWIGIVVSMSCCVVAAHYWMVFVEPVFGRVTGWVEGVVSGKDGEENRAGRGSRTGRGLGLSPIVGRGMDGRDTLSVSIGHANGVLTPPRERSLTPRLLEASMGFDREKEIGRMA